MQSVVYDGGHFAVDVIDPLTGREVASEVQRGQSVDVPDHVADDLLQRLDWKPADKPKAQKDGGK